MMQDWKMPDTSIIHLSNGEVVDAEVNGKSLDGQSGYVYWGRGIQVERIDDDTWIEKGASMVNMDLHWSDSCGSCICNLPHTYATHYKAIQSELSQLQDERSQFEHSRSIDWNDAKLVGRGVSEKENCQ